MAVPLKTISMTFCGGRLKLFDEGRQTYPISPGDLTMEYKLPASYIELHKALLEGSQ